MTLGFKRNSDESAPPASAQVSANDAFDLGTQFDQRGDLPAAEEAYRAAAELGHPAAAVSLGVLLEERDDLAGAEQAFRRADERGDATGAFHLAWLLQENDDHAGAEEAYRRADLRGHPAAGANLKMLRAPAPAAPKATPARAAPRAAAPAPAPAAPAPETAPAPAAPRAAAPAREAGAPPAPVARALAPVDTYAAIAANAAHAADVQLSPDLIAQLNRSGRESRGGRSAAPPARRGAAKRPAPRAATAPRSGRAAPAARGRAEQRNTPQKLSRKERRAQRREAESSGGLPKVVSWLLPILAFGVAFVAGAETKAQTHAPAHLAPAANVTGASATIAAMTPLPQPAKLVKPPPKKPAKPATTTTAGTVVRPVLHYQPVYRVPVRTSVPPPATPTQGPRTTTTAPGSGGTPVVTTSSANGTGTSTGSG